MALVASVVVAGTLAEHRQPQAFAEPIAALEAAGEVGTEVALLAHYESVVAGERTEHAGCVTEGQVEPIAPGVPSAHAEEVAGVHAAAPHPAAVEPVAVPVGPSYFVEAVVLWCVGVVAPVVPFVP